MTERPRALRDLDAYASTSVIAHEAVFGLHREVTMRGRANAQMRQLLHESADIALRELPRTTSEARRLAIHWDDQSVLDPGGADATLRALTAELERVAPRITRLLDRQREIAGELRSHLER